MQILSNNVFSSRLNTWLLLKTIVLGLLFLSCNNEDDINSMFVGRTWYVTGCTFNGVRVSGEDIKSIYTTPGTYILQFVSSESFSIVVDGGNAYSGKWRADGSNQHIKFDFRSLNTDGVNALSSKILQIIENATYYSGDEHNMIIKQDKYNFVSFSNSRDI